MKVGWSLRPLGDVCDRKPSKGEARRRLVDTDKVSFVPMNELGIHQKYFEAAETRPLSAVAGSYTYFADGDVLLAKITPCFENGKLGIAHGLENGIGFGSSEFMVLRPKSELLPEYLYYFLDQEPFREVGAKAMTGAVGHKRIPPEFVEALPLPRRPLDEQRRIVAVLDKAFAGIATATANAQKNLANARDLFESYLDQIFGDPVDDWHKKTIGEIAAIKGGKRVPKGYKLLSEPTPYPYISVADFNDEGSVDTAKIRYISEQIFNQIKRYIIRKEDLYVSIAGTVGKTGIVPPNLDGASLTENACRLVFNKGILNRFVYFFTLTSSFKDQAIEQTRTAAQPNRGCAD